MIRVTMAPPMLPRPMKPTRRGLGRRPSRPSAVQPSRRNRIDAPGRQATGAHDGGGRVAHLPRPAVTAQLGDRLVDQAHPVGAPMRQLAAVRVEREITVEGDALARVEEVLGLADPAESERLESRSRN